MYLNKKEKDQIEKLLTKMMKYILKKRKSFDGRSIYEECAKCREILNK